MMFETKSTFQASRLTRNAKMLAGAVILGTMGAALSARAQPGVDGESGRGVAGFVSHSLDVGNCETPILPAFGPSPAAHQGRDYCVAVCVSRGRECPPCAGPALRFACAAARERCEWECGPHRWQELSGVTVAEVEP
ncbi:MAG TPA: hypothetical protein VGY54_13520 [Polyangiaceae bacterium]|jgi:hypothetical protein|nr:hypothetical protein [Polyangiaceae bacterium]